LSVISTIDQPSTGSCLKRYCAKRRFEKCFDRINHQALLSKLAAIQPITKLVRGWLKAGMVDQGQTLFPTAIIRITVTLI
jgi:hypothetical protein